jgi:ABC-type sugar transport system ATPase subunit
VRSGECLVLVGASGSGKTTLLRLIAGLESPDEGAVWLGGRSLERVSPSARDVALVAQSPALYPHLSVRANMGFGWRSGGASDAGLERRGSTPRRDLKTNSVGDIAGDLTGRAATGCAGRAAIGRVWEIRGSSHGAEDGVSSGRGVGDSGAVEDGYVHTANRVGVADVLRRALLPWWPTWFGWSRPGAETSVREARIEQLAERLGVAELLDRFPHQLSGGERQRVALGRAVVREPAAFLFDEPLAAVDPPQRVALRIWLAAMLRGSAAASVYVTHDFSEAVTLGDRVAVLDGGRVQQVGAPKDIYRWPATWAVAEVFAPRPMNRVAARWVPRQADDGLEVVDRNTPSQGHAGGDPVGWIGIRPSIEASDCPADVAPSDRIRGPVGPVGRAKDWVQRWLAGHWDSAPFWLAVDRLRAAKWRVELGDDGSFGAESLRGYRRQPDGGSVGDPGSLWLAVRPEHVVIGPAGSDESAGSSWGSEEADTADWVRGLAGVVVCREDWGGEVWLGVALGQGTHDSAGGGDSGGGHPGGGHPGGGHPGGGGDRRRRSHDAMDAIELTDEDAEAIKQTLAGQGGPCETEGWNNDGADGGRGQVWWGRWNTSGSAKAAQVGTRVELAFSVERLHFFGATSGRNLGKDINETQ